MVRIFKDTSAPSFETEALTFGVAVIRIFGLGWIHCLMPVRLEIFVSEAEADRNNKVSISN